MRKSFYKILFSTLTLFFSAPLFAAEGYNCSQLRQDWEGSPLSMAQGMMANHDAEGLHDAAKARRTDTPRVVSLNFPTFDIPVVINDQVIKWMDYFQGAGRKHFVRWLSRIDRYGPMITKVLREHGVPEDMIFLAMIESGFQPSARSHASAVGMWQFMRHTGKQYGLRVNYWIDERRDPFKATLAAAQHINDLFEQFNNWYLAAAGYNAGAGKISRAIQRHNTTDFWELSKTRYIRRETKDYVPKLLAAAIIAKSPDAYGFRGLQYHEPLEFEIVEINQFSDLRKIAESSKISLKELRELNPELRHHFTPPDINPYLLRVPTGTASMLAELQDQDLFKANQQKAYVYHRVRSRETVRSIAQRYGISSATLADLNDDVGKRRRPLRVGMTLKVPVSGSSDESLPSRRIRKAKASIQPIEHGTQETSRYRVQPGDTLWSISRRFNVSVADLKRWNRLPRARKLYAGMYLNIKKSS